MLSRRTKIHPVYIGEPGVGKRAAVEGLSQRIVAEEGPNTLKKKRIVTLDLPSLVAGAKHCGEFEERLKTVLQDVQETNGVVILFITSVIQANKAVEGIAQRIVAEKVPDSLKKKRIVTLDLPS